MVILVINHYLKYMEYSMVNITPCLSIFKPKYIMHLSLIILLSLSQSLLSNDSETSELGELYNLSLEQLMDLTVVTASKKEEKVGDIPASVVVISRDDIERNGYANLDEVLQSVTGFYSINSRAFIGNVYGVRGYWSGWPRNLIVMVNGVEQLNSYRVFHMQNINVPIEAIDRVEIVKGPMSVIYGSDGFLGAINIITNEGFDNSSLVSTSYGTNNSKRAHYRLNKSFDELKLIFNGGYYDTDGPDEPLSRLVSDMSMLEQFGISEENNNTTTEKRLEHNHIYFGLSGKYKEYSADLVLSQSDREEYHFWPSFSDGLLNRMTFSTLRLGYNREIFSDLELRLNYKYYYSAYWREFDYFAPDYFGHEMDDSRKHKFELNGLYTPSNKIDIITGFELEDSERVSKLDIRDEPFKLSTGGYIDNIQSYVLFSQGNYRATSSLSFTGGVRFEKHSEYDFKYVNKEEPDPLQQTNYYKFDLKGWEVIPRVASIYHFNKDHTIKLLYGKAVKFPATIDILHQLISESDMLETEYIDTYEINYLANFSNYLNLNFSVFRNDLDNLLTQFLQFDDEGNWEPKVTNSGEMETYGVELSIKSAPLEKLILELSGTYQETEHKSEHLKGKAVGYSPNLLSKLRLTYLPFEDLTLSFNGNYVDEMETLWDLTIPNEDGTHGARLGNKVDSYFTFGANIRYENLLLEGSYINLRCSNIFDTDYLYPIYTSNSGWIDKGMFGDGRNITLTAGWKF